MSLELADLVGIDIGGTYTDFVFERSGRVDILKLPTDLEHPGACLREGLGILGVESDCSVVHGTTVATNALLERSGVRTALVTTSGFEDVIRLSRQQRPSLYGVTQILPTELVPEALRLGVRERVDAEGLVIEPLREEELERIGLRLEAESVESVAIVFLFSFLDPTHELCVAEHLRNRFPDMDISVSSDLLPEYREYERTTTTVANAYLNPLVRHYMEKLVSSIGDRPFYVMHSGAGVADTELATKESARLVLSGPAGGVVGAFEVARRSEKCDNPLIISLDMGGTSTDVCLCDGEIPLTPTSVVGEVPIRFPSVDIHTVGAGGGSIAWIDDGDVLRVGPQSAGANPGPVAYGRGGSEPTVTDANLVLGRILPDQRFGGGGDTQHLDAEVSAAAISHLGKKLGLSLHEAALGIVRIANARMERALRTVSIERGHDPRRFGMVPFGGAGPLHACALSEALGIQSIVIPHFPGVLSAMGLCQSGVTFDRSRSFLSVVDELKNDGDAFSNICQELQEEISRNFARLHLQPRISLAGDLRYIGQSHELTVGIPLKEGQPDVSDINERFHETHERRFGYRLDASSVQLVTLRARGQAERDAVTHRHEPTQARKMEPRIHKIWFSSDGPLDTPVYDRRDLDIGQTLKGPALITQSDTTILVEPGWLVVVDSEGFLLIHRTSAP